VREDVEFGMRVVGIKWDEGKAEWAAEIGKSGERETKTLIL
jgi:hypothetical protein